MKQELTKREFENYVKEFFVGLDWVSNDTFKFSFKKWIELLKNTELELNPIEK